MWSLVCWLVGFEATGFCQEAYCDSWSASQSAQARPVFLILVTCAGAGVGVQICSKRPHGFDGLLWYSEKTCTISSNTCVPSLFLFRLNCSPKIMRHHTSFTAAWEPRRTSRRRGEETMFDTPGEWCSERACISRRRLVIGKNLNGSRLVLRCGVFCVMVTSSGESCAARCQHISCNESGVSPLPKRPGDILTSSATITARCGPWVCHRRDRLPTLTDAAVFCWTCIQHKTIYRVLSHFVLRSKVVEGSLLFPSPSLCASVMAECNRFRLQS